ncbi:MAG: hypothetical protein MR388_04815 [Tenericutes bacterium]|nr:hypothetical protein [Mycoplasmatota bacterium]
MIKDIIFNRNVLSIYLENKINKKNIQILRKRLYYIINEYGVSNIVIHLNNITYMDTEAFYDLLDEYDDEFGGHLKLEKGEKIL